MEKVLIKVEKVSKKFNIYRKSIHKIAGVLFGKEPSEIKQALTDVSFEIKQGERVAIMGSVEAGRTTLMTILAGVVVPSKGKVTVNGTMNVMLNAKAGMEMEFTCRENIYTKANVVGLSRKEVEPYEKDILEFAEATDFANLSLKSAPKGSPALISLAVHLIKDADIIIIDEVFGGGGSQTRMKCENRLKEYLDSHTDKSLILVDGTIPYKNEICDRAIVLDEGKVYYDGHDIDEAERIYRTVNSK